MFPDEEGKVVLADEFEVRGEGGLEPVEGAATGPAVWRGEFREPCTGRGEDEFAARADEGGEAFEEEERIGEPADEVGGVHEVECAERIREVHGIAAGEGDSLREGVGWAMRGEWPCEISFLSDFAVDVIARAEGSGRVDEGLGKVDADDFAAEAGEFEGRATDGAADVEGAGAWGWIRHFRDGAEGEVEGGDRSLWPWEDLVRCPVMEEEVFVNEAGGFVEVRHWLQRVGREKGKGLPQQGDCGRPWKS